MAARTPSPRRGKVLVCKVGLDGHEAGAKLVGRVLVQAGFEVIYTGRRQTVATVVATSRQEDVDVIGVSLLSGTHLHVARDLVAALREEPEPPPVVMGGIIPPDDYATLYEYGVAAVLGPGATPREIVAAVEGALAAQEQSSL
jgi:methylmalonyl-CoA mutase C-terminal domain/subunit